MIIFRKFVLKLQSAVCQFQTVTVFDCSFIKLLPYVLLEKYINIFALEMASPGNRHCASCISVLSFPIDLGQNLSSLCVLCH